MCICNVAHSTFAFFTQFSPMNENLHDNVWKGLNPSLMISFQSWRTEDLMWSLFRNYETFLLLNKLSQPPSINTCMVYGPLFSVVCWSTVVDYAEASVEILLIEANKCIVSVRWCGHCLIYTKKEYTKSMHKDSYLVISEENICIIIWEPVQRGVPLIYTW